MLEVVLLCIIANLAIAVWVYVEDEEHPVLSFIAAATIMAPVVIFGSLYSWALRRLKRAPRR